MLNNARATRTSGAPHAVRTSSHRRVPCAGGMHAPSGAHLDRPCNSQVQEARLLPAETEAVPGPVLVAVLFFFLVLIVLFLFRQLFRPAARCDRDRVRAGAGRVRQRRQRWGGGRRTWWQWRRTTPWWQSRRRRSVREGVLVHMARVGVVVVRPGLVGRCRDGRAWQGQRRGRGRRGRRGRRRGRGGRICRGRHCCRRRTRVAWRGRRIFLWRLVGGRVVVRIGALVRMRNAGRLTMLRRLARDMRRMLVRRGLRRAMRRMLLMAMLVVMCVSRDPVPVLVAVLVLLLISRFMLVLAWPKLGLVAETPCWGGGSGA